MKIEIQRPKQKGPIVQGEHRLGRESTRAIRVFKKSRRKQRCPCCAATIRGSSSEPKMHNSVAGADSTKQEMNNSLYHHTAIIFVFSDEYTIAMSDAICCWMVCPTGRASCDFPAAAGRELLRHLADASAYSLGSLGVNCTHAKVYN